MAEETMNDFMDEIDKSLAKGKDGDGFIWDKLHALLDSGEYVDVEVTEAVKGGVVAFLEEKRGFIPASKLSLSYIDEEKLPEFVGKTLKVKVITVDEEDDKLVLSAKDYLKEEAEKKKAEAIAKVQVGLVLSLKMVHQVFCTSLRSAIRELHILQRFLRSDRQLRSR